MPRFDPDKSLTWNLDQLGIRHVPSPVYLKRTLFRGEERLGDLDASEGWAFVRAEYARSSEPDEVSK